MNIGKALKETRLNMGVKQKTVAEETGITQSYICLIEKEQKTPSIDVIETLCKYYGVPIGIIMWRAIDVKDVTPNKRQAFTMLKPHMDDIVNRIFK